MTKVIALDELAKIPIPVIPAKAGIQKARNLLDYDFGRNDDLR
jgi:hypothetical protein